MTGRRRPLGLPGQPGRGGRPCSRGGAGRLREPCDLPGFVLGSARNPVNNHHRKQNRAPEVLQDPPDRPDETDLQWAGLDNERGGLSRKARAAKEVAGEIERATRTRPPDHMGMSGPRP